MSTECTYKIKINSIYKDDQRKNYIEFTCFTLSDPLPIASYSTENAI